MLDLLAPPPPTASPAPALRSAEPVAAAPVPRPRGRWRRRFERPTARRARGPWVAAVAFHAALLGVGLVCCPPARLAIGEALHGCLVVSDAAAPETEPVRDVVELATPPPPDPIVDLPEVAPVETAPDEEVLPPLDAEPELPDAPAELDTADLPSSDATLVRQRVGRPPPPVEPTRAVAVAAPAVAPATSVPVAPSGRAQLRPRFRPAPPYPEALRQSGLEGVVTLRIVIEADGSVSEATVVTSSGHEAFDTAAVETLRRWQFEPVGERRVVPSIPVRFRLR